MKFIDRIDENGTDVLLHNIMPTVVIPLNDVYIAYMLSDVENGKTCVLVRCRSNKS